MLSQIPMWPFAILAPLVALGLWQRRLRLPRCSWSTRSMVS
jgi:hypothetical protein